MRISDWSSDVCSSDLKRLNEVSGDGGVIDFSVGADADADESLRYLRNKGGAFGAIYSTQMSEMGLVHFPGPDQPNPNPVCSDIALQLADAVASELRSEERRVGRECVSTCRSRWSQCHYKKKRDRYITNTCS